MRPRIRSLKPEIHTDEELWDLEVESGLPLFRAFTGLWNYADREGRFEWRPRALKAMVLPYWSGEFERALAALASRRFIIKYEVGGKYYGWIRKLKDHQAFNAREPGSVLPPPPPEVVHMHARAEHGSAHGELELISGAGAGAGAGAEHARAEPPPPSSPEQTVTRPLPPRRVQPVEPLLTEPPGHTRIPADWQPSAALRADATMAGVAPETLAEDVTYWRGRKLGGEWHDLDQFFRAHLPRLRKKQETEQARLRSEPAQRAGPRGVMAVLAEERDRYLAEEALEEAQKGVSR